MVVTRQVAIIQHDTEAACYECSQHIVKHISDWATVTEAEYRLLQKFCVRRGWVLVQKPTVTEILMMVPDALAEEAALEAEREKKKAAAEAKRRLREEQRRKKSEAEEKKLLQQLKEKYGDNSPTTNNSGKTGNKQSR